MPNMERKMATRSVDDIFERIGQFGRAQKKYYFMIGFVSFILSYQYFLTTFTDYSPEWDCVDSFDHYHRFANHCIMYERGLCFAKHSNPHLTIVTEWDLICKSAYYTRYPQSAFFIGSILSNFMMGPLGDFAGRKVLLQSCLALLSFSGLICVGSMGVTMYIILRFFMGIFSQGAVLGIFVWIFEMIGPSHRGNLQTYMGFFGIAGAITMPLMSALLQDWRAFILVASLVTGIPLFYLSFVPESPSWLLVNGRRYEAESVFRKISEENNTAFPEDLELEHVECGHKKQLGFFTLFSHSRIALQTAILILCWFSVCLTYYGVTFALGEKFGGNKSFTFIFSFILEIPSIFLSLHLANTYGRRFAMSRLLVLSGGCLVCSFIVSDVLRSTSPILSFTSRIGFAVLGKVLVSAVFAVAYFFTSELFPTEVRNVGLATVSFSARIGGAISPFVLSSSNLLLTISALGLLCGVSGMCSLKLPETLGRPLPNTLAEMRRSKSSEAIL